MPDNLPSYMESLSMGGHRTEIVIGIDFGTTYSGVSWAVKAGSQKINQICNWPNPMGANLNSEKTPSVVSHKGGLLHKWGYDVDETSRPETFYKWMKILLEPKAIRSSDSECYEAVWATQRLLDQEGRTAVEAVGEYLSQIWKYTLEEIGSKQGADFQETYKLRVVLTVPAVWSAKAKDNTLQAARRGGLPEDITMVTEPEAAALMALKQRNEIGSLRIGETFVVCDAGGGTVDLISYQVEQTNPLRLKECAEGSGGLCGAIFVNEGFKKLIMTKIGEAQWNSDKITDKNKARMWRDFESRCKCPFDPDHSEDYEVELKGVKDDPSNGIEDYTIQISTSALKTIFDHVCLQINKLVTDQIAQVRSKGASVKNVLLVGGFGESKYLRKLLTEALESEKIPVLTVSGGWSAISRGAVEWGLERGNDSTGHPAKNSTVVSRIARYSYGFRLNQIFDPNVHSVQDRWWDDERGQWMARNQMAWILKRGQELRDGAELEYDVERTCKVGFWTFGDLEFSSGIYHCALEKPPGRCTEMVQMLCEVLYPMSATEFYTLSKKIKNGQDKKVRRLDLKLKMSLGNALLGFSVLYADGKVAAQCDAQYMEDSESL